MVFDYPIQEHGATQRRNQIPFAWLSFHHFLKQFHSVLPGSDV